ncbi:hypothetical protein EV426DRAFT_602801 [Tirmania nivea]|nr:hypothetical protein EV426DRAFT_602801 [Tirmania nivea]
MKLCQPLLSRFLLLLLYLVLLVVYSMDLYIVLVPIPCKSKGILEETSRQPNNTFSYSAQVLHLSPVGVDVHTFGSKALRHLERATGLIWCVF